MNYLEAKNLVFNFLSLNHKTFSDKNELDAIVTHWVLNPQICPPEMPAEIFVQCRRLFGFPYNNDINNDLLAEKQSFYQLSLDFNSKDLPFPPIKEPKFTFIDLFAGIGGIRIAFQNAGGRCVFSSEWDKYAKKTYEVNFGEVPYGDLRKIDKTSIPEHDILLAGFPCQPFSIAGISKNKSLGRKHGFEDETRGTLFFEIKEILRQKQPKAFMLENVKNLLNHDKGRTFQIIKHVLEDTLGYVINWSIVDGARWVPQHRERIFIVGYKPDKVNITRNEIVIPGKPGKAHHYIELNDVIVPDVEGYTLGPGTWNTLQRHKAYHKAAGNGFGYGIHKFPIPKGAVTRTISARYHKDGAEILIEQKDGLPRKLTLEEAMQLQGLDPKRFKFPVSKTQAYKQIGNSVVVPAVLETAKEMAKVIMERSN